MFGTKKNYIGILGGSFDPPHQGHVAITKIALKKAKFKKVYWVITKKNPFKKKPFWCLWDIKNDLYICDRIKV